MVAVLWPRWCSGRRMARPPARLGVLTSFGAAPRSPPVPSGPSGALHTSGAWCAVGCLGSSARCPARPRHRPPAPRQVPPAPSNRSGCLCVAWPGLATAHRHRSRALRRRASKLARPWCCVWLPLRNVARNSSGTALDFELSSLVFQCFWLLLSGWSDRITCDFSEERAHGYLLVVQPEPANRVCGCLKLMSPWRVG